MFRSLLLRNPILAPRVFCRGKKQAASVNESTQKVVNQLLALSARKKQPKLLRLCNEDYVKHRTIDNAWKVYQRQQADKRQTQLKQQYDSIVNAMDDLKQTSPELFEMASQPPPKNNLFPLDMRVPTDFPAHKPWVYNYADPSK